MQHPTATAASRDAEGAVPDAAWHVRWGRRLLALAASLMPVAFALALLVPTTTSARVAAPESPRTMTLHVTDRGIDQMRHWESGREQGLTWSMSKLDRAARIAVVMPRGADFDRITTQDLQRQIFDDLKGRIDDARRNGRSEVEIQLVQDIDVVGYTGPRQGDVARFGSAAYGAIRDIGAYLQRQEVRVTNRAVLGSNGSVVFAANVEAWSAGGRGIWDSVDIFDGRAYLTPMVKAIDRIGPARVRIFNTESDWVAPHTPWAFRSIGNPATTQQLKDEYFPNLRVYKLTSLSAQRGHISGMSDANRFLVDEYKGSKEGYKPVPGIASGSDLRRPQALPAAIERSIPPDVANGVAVWRSAAQGYVNALSAFAEAYADEHGEKNPLTPVARVLPRAATLVQAVNEDIADAREGPVVILKSHTLEKLLDLTLETAAKSPAAARSWFKPFAKDVDAITELQSGLMEAVRSGKVGIDTMQSFDQATVELARRQMTERQAAAVARQFKLRELESAASQLERQVEQAAKAVRLGSSDLHIDRGRSNDLRVLTNRLTAATAKLEGARSAARLAEQRFAARALGLDALPEFAAAIAEHAKQGRMTLDVVDRYSDAVITLSASYLAAATAAVPPLAAYAPAVREAIVASSRLVRDTVGRQMFQNPGKWEVLEQYLVYQNQAVRGPDALKTFSEMLGADTLRKLGFSKQEIAAQDEQAQRLNAALAHRRADQQVARRQLAPPAAPQVVPAHAPPELRRDSPKLPPPRQMAAPPPPPPCGPGGSTCGGIDLGLTALVVDPATRKIVALAEGGTPQTEAVGPNLMALALWLEYTGQRAAFSLDPYDPKNPSGPWLRAVYFPEALRGTVAGNHCFDADFLLKQMSFGVRVEGDRVVERRSESGLVSVPELMGKRARPSPEQWSRMWIVSREVRLSASDGIVRVEQAKMGVEARRQVPDASTRTGLRDVATPSDATEQQFARQFEQLFDQLAATEAPSLAAVRETTKALALARWMRMSGVRVDMQAVVAQLDRARVPAVDKVSALSVGWSSQTQTPFSDHRGSGITTTTRKLHMFGGVDLAVAPKVERSSRDLPLREAVASALQRPDAPARFELTQAGRVYRAYVMPFQIASGRGLWQPRSQASSGTREGA